MKPMQRQSMTYIASRIQKTPMSRQLLVKLRLVSTSIWRHPGGGA